jgi:hypothetical protein
VVPQTSPSAETSTYIFSQRELQRLATYRAAVVARFYNDDCDPIHAADQSSERRHSPRRTRSLAA